MIINVFCGCNSEPSNNSVNIEKGIYNYLTDAPLSKSMPIPSDVNIAKCETGYYVLNGNKIYYVEQSTMDAIPLCNKPNCTHNNNGCNAILGNVRNIYYSDGYIYYLSDAGEEKGFIGNYLVKMSPDGSTKENILYLELSPTDWTIHRNTFYYSIRVYQIDENTGLEDLAYSDCYIYSYSLDKESKPKEIYFAEEISEGAQISTLMAFGNNLYFEMFGGCRYEKGEIFKTVKLSIEDNTCTDMITTEGYILTRPMYIDGHLLFSVFNSQSNLKYITDFDGNNPELFWEIDSDKTIFCDGKYIYVDNFYALDSTNDKDRFIEVYDIDLNKVDEFSLGNGSDRTYCLLPIGSEVFVIVDKDVDGDVIFYYNKGEIGTLNGKKWNKTYSYKENG